MQGYENTGCHYDMKPLKIYEDTSVVSVVVRYELPTLPCRSPKDSVIIPIFSAAYLDLTFLPPL
jgi:hypothetical protein